jgi:phage shock protein C
MKQLYRSKVDRKVAGICGGLAEYLEMDPTLIRVIWLSAILLGGSGLILYIAWWLIVPDNPQETGELNLRPLHTHMPPLRRSRTNKIIAGVCGGLGNYFRVDPVLIRIAFIILTMGIGWGIMFYIILWVAVPQEK